MHHVVGDLSTHPGTLKIMRCALLMEAKIRGHMPENDAFVVGLIYTPQKDFFTAVALNCPLASAVAEPPITLDIYYMTHPSVLNMFTN